MRMKWKSSYQHPQGWKFEIHQDDPRVGYYLYIWNAAGKNTHDYLQDTLAVAQEQAFEDFGIPMDSWIKVE